jgi:hypothetical protein
MHVRRPLAVAVLAALASAPAFAQSPAPTPLPNSLGRGPAVMVSPPSTIPPALPSPDTTPSPGAVTIVNSGSTNSASYTIALEPTGVAYLKSDGVTVVRRVDLPTTNAFFAALAKVKPLSSIVTQHCMKSVSFGSRTMVAVGGQTSPDISCGGDANTEALFMQVTAVANAVHAGFPPSHRRRLLDDMRPATPAASAMP